jgi:pSer/pThr/pTyr-binding forkhead associated (FHA) protein
VPLDGALTGELLQIKTRAIIGTADGCEIRLFDASISGRHSEITLGQNGRYRVTDLGSRNGTYVNDKAIASVELVDGDNIRLGRTTFRFKTKA